MWLAGTWYVPHRYFKIPLALWYGINSLRGANGKDNRNS